MLLERIPLNYWTSFIRSRFAQTGKQIPTHIIEQLYAYVDGNSSYMQQFAWIMWSMTQDEVTQDCFETAKNRVFAQNQPLFQEQLDKLKKKLKVY